MGTGVVSVTSMAASSGKYNVVPDRSSFGGTVRSLSHEHFTRLKRRVTEVTAYPPLLNTCMSVFSVGRKSAGDAHPRVVQHYIRHPSGGLA